MNIADIQFDARIAVVENNAGLRGVLRVRSDDGRHLLEAELFSTEPDCSDDERRAQCQLSITLSEVKDGAFESKTQIHKEYVYHGDDPGDHLQDLLDDGLLLEHLESATT